MEARLHVHLRFRARVNFTLGGSGSLTLGSGYLTRSPGASGTQTISQGVILDANGMWYIAGAGQLAVSGPISGAFSLEKLNSGTLTFSGTNTYSQGTIVAAGTLIVANSNAILSGSNLTVGSGALFAAPTVMTPPVTTLSVSEGGKLSAAALQSTGAANAIPADATKAPRVDRSSQLTAVNRAAADMAFLRTRQPVRTMTARAARRMPRSGPWTLYLPTTRDSEHFSLRAWCGPLWGIRINAHVSSDCRRRCPLTLCPL